MKIGFKLIIVILAAIVLVNIVIFRLFPINSPVYTVKPLKSISFYIDDVDDNIPSPAEIIYYSKNGTWELQDKETYNEKIDKKVYRSRDNYEIYSYSPNVTIEGSNISFNFGIKNNMGTDILEVPLTVETRISMKFGKNIPPTQKTIILNNLKDGEYREIRLSAELIKPPENETLREVIILTTPIEVTALNGSVVTQNQPDPALGSAMFYIRPANAYIGIERAMENVREFIEKPDALVDFNADESSWNRETYVLQVEGGVFQVDMVTGDIELVRFNDASGRSAQVKLSLEDAETIALGYAEKNYRNFAQKKMRLTTSELRERAEVSEYAFIWNEVVNNIETQNNVQVYLNPSTGEIIAYLGQQIPITVQLEPKILRDDAIKIATSQFTDIEVLRTEAKLNVKVKEFEVQKLIWVIDIEGMTKNNADSEGFVEVDAITGDVITMRTKTR